MRISILLTLIVFQFSYSQKITIDISLSKIIDETSGLEIIDGQFVTHNDSGGDPALYYLDEKGKIVETRKIAGVKNTDWEDITKDEEFLYVANMGNNYDTRKNLSIVKIPIQKSSNENVEVINFSYPEQKKFKRIYRRSEYDAEALISFEDKLLIFTKNKRKKITEIYSLPKNGGNYQAKKIGSLNTDSIVTGGDYDKETNTLALTSTIKFDEYYVLIISDFRTIYFDISHPSLLDKNITFYTSPEGKVHPEDKLDPNLKLLEGFIWRKSERPESLDDLFK